MNIRLEDIDVIRERTNASYTMAYEALEKCNGDVVKAILFLENGEKTVPNFDSARKESSTAEGNIEKNFNEVIEKVIAAIKEGNVNKVELLKDGKVVLSVPVNVGIVGGLLGVSLMPWAIIPAFLAVYTLGCKFRIVRDDDSTEYYE